MADEKTLAPVTETAISADLRDTTVFGGDSALALYCSIPRGDLTQRQYAAKISKLLQGSALNADEHMSTGNAVLHVSNILAHAVEMEDQQTGEKRDAIRTVLECVKNPKAPADKQETFLMAFVSVGVVGALKKIFALVGMPPYVPPLAVSLHKQKAKTGHVLTLLIAEE